MNFFFGRISSCLSNNVLKPSIFLQQTADFSKFISKARTKRQPMNTKRAGKGFYKGKGARKEGRLTKKGHFIRMPELCTELIVPNLFNFKLKPYIAYNAKRNIIDSVVKL